MIRTSLGPGITFFPQPMTLVGSSDSSGVNTGAWAGRSVPPTAPANVSFRPGREPAGGSGPSR